MEKEWTMCASYKGSLSDMVNWISVSSHLVHFVDVIKDLYSGM